MSDDEKGSIIVQSQPTVTAKISPSLASVKLEPIQIKQDGCNFGIQIEVEPIDDVIDNKTQPQLRPQSLKSVPRWKVRKWVNHIHNKHHSRFPSAHSSRQAKKMAVSAVAVGGRGVFIRRHTMISRQRCRAKPVQQKIVYAPPCQKCIEKRIRKKETSSRSKYRDSLRPRNPNVCYHNQCGSSKPSTSSRSRGGQNEVKILYDSKSESQQPPPPLYVIDFRQNTDGDKPIASFKSQMKTKKQDPDDISKCVMVKRAERSFSSFNVKQPKTERSNAETAVAVCVKHEPISNTKPDEIIVIH